MLPWVTRSPHVAPDGPPRTDPCVLAVLSSASILDSPQSAVAPLFQTPWPVAPGTPHLLPRVSVCTSPALRHFPLASTPLAQARIWEFILDSSLSLIPHV